jgi:hypothetical protein
MTTQHPAATKSAETNARCGNCGAAFTCGLAAGCAECWCAALPNVVPVPRVDSRASCLCPACLAAAVQKAAPPVE